MPILDAALTTLGAKVGNPFRSASLLVFIAVASFMLSGCISAKHYVDPAYANIQPTDIKPPKTPEPVQVFFEFRNKEGTSASATKLLKPRVVTFLSNSRCFSQVTTEGQEGTNSLFLTMTNFAIADDATAKGVGVGLTFGLVGAMVSDGYTLEATYRSGDREPVKRTYKHALHSTVGNKDGPPGLTPVSVQDAIYSILDQMLTSLLIDLFSVKTPASL